MRENTEMNAEDVRKALHYDPQTGLFTWIISAAQAVSVGQPAGCLVPPEGYVQIQLGGKKYRAHRLAWLYVTGAWPNDEIDHIDGQRANNRFVNLREATRLQNMANYSKPVTNTTGFKGVFKESSGRWSARIQIRKEKHYLGMFDSPELAAAAYNVVARGSFGEFARES